jgi:quercetin dioxygenase-like cupin family protein
MKNVKWMIAVSVVSAGLGAAGGVLAAKNKEIVVTPSADLKFQPLDPSDKEGKGVQMSVVFGDAKKKAPIGYLLRVPAGMTSPAHMHSSDDYAVVLKGGMTNHAPGGEAKVLAPGSTWFQPGHVAHVNDCSPGAPCEIFVYMPKGFDYMPAPEAAKAEAPKAEAAKAPAPKAEAPKAEPAKK